MTEIANNLDRLMSRITKCCGRAHRSLDEIKIVAVTKTVTVPAIIEAIDLGLEDLGENRVQEMALKHREVGERVSWHMVGHLQTNKVRGIIDFCKLIQSVDSFKLASEISRQALKADIEARILIQTNMSGEETKWGVGPEEVRKLIEEIAPLENLKVLGLMTIAPLTEEKGEVRDCFRKLRSIFDETRVMESELGIDKVQMKYLSMGMTNDFEIAIEEGANMIRIGSAIFGPRR